MTAREQRILSRFIWLKFQREPQARFEAVEQWISEFEVRRVKGTLGTLIEEQLPVRTRLRVVDSDDGEG